MKFFLKWFLDNVDKLQRFYTCLFPLEILVCCVNQLLIHEPLGPVDQASSFMTLDKQKINFLGLQSKAVTLW